MRKMIAAALAVMILAGCGGSSSVVEPAQNTPTDEPTMENIQTQLGAYVDAVMNADVPSMYELLSTEVHNDISRAEWSSCVGQELVNFEIYEVSSYKMTVLDLYEEDGQWFADLRADVGTASGDQTDNDTVTIDQEPDGTWKLGRSVSGFGCIAEASE